MDRTTIVIAADTLAILQEQVLAEEARMCERGFLVAKITTSRLGDQRIATIDFIEDEA